MKRKALAAIMAVAMAVSMAGCGGSPSESKDSTQKTETADSTASTGGSVENKDKPLCWFNRQPSSSATGELDKDALNFNGNTYYVGFDANQGAELQGQMVLDYIKKNADTIDRNGDGVIGYVLAIGDIGHNDSIARTRGVRSALGTGVDADGGVDSTPAGTNVDGKAKVVQDATLDVDGKTYTIRDQIDGVVSNNDGMGMSMFNAWAKDNKVPTFGYDANSDAVAAIAEGYGGTISQHADVQAYLTLRVLRNALDGVDINTGIGTADEAGNCLTEGEDYRYSEEERSYYALNIAVTADNYNDFTDSTKVYDKVAKQLDESKSPSKKVWLNIYNASDNFLSSTYQPLLEKYDDLLNLKVDYIGGDGQTESNITNRLGNPSEYDAFAINMVKTDNAAAYTSLLSK